MQRSTVLTLVCIYVCEREAGTMHGLENVYLSTTRLGKTWVDAVLALNCALCPLPVAL